MQLTGCSQIVCDPLPPPVDCARGLTADDLMRLNVQAKWIQGAGGFTAKVDLIFYASNVTFSGEPILEGANLVSSDIGPRNSTSTPASFTFSPAAGVTMVRASLSVRCDDGATTTMHLTLDVSGTPQAGAAIPVTVKP